MPGEKIGPPPPGDGAPPWWQELSAHSDEAEARAEIARLIRIGEVTVRPIPGDPERVEVIPRETSPAKIRPDAGRNAG